MMAVALSSDHLRAVSGSSDNTVKIWDLSIAKRLHSLTGHMALVTRVAITADGRSIVSGSKDKTVRMWDTSSGRLLHSFTGHTDHITGVAIAQDGSRVISSSSDGTLKMADKSTGQQEDILINETAITSLAWSFDERYLVCGDKKGRIWIFEWIN